MKVVWETAHLHGEKMMFATVRTGKTVRYRNAENIMMLMNPLGHARVKTLAYALVENQLKNDAQMVVGQPEIDYAETQWLNIVLVYGINEVGQTPKGTPIMEFNLVLCRSDEALEVMEKVFKFDIDKVARELCAS